MSEHEEYDDLVVVLSGGNQTEYGRIFGMATDVVIGCPDLKQDLRVGTYDFSDRRVFPNYPEAPRYIKQLRRNKLDLKAVEEMITEKMKCPQPLEVYVIAKKKVAVIITEYGESRFLGSAVVGDPSGICEIVMFNDAIESIFNCISPGDKILINTGWINGRVSTGSNFASFFNPEMVLYMEIKFNVFDARKIFVVKDVTGNRSKALPAVVGKIKTDEVFNKLWTATDILHEDSNKHFQAARRASEELKNKRRDQNFEAGPVTNFDVIGVIKHAGRLERKANLKEERGFNCKIKNQDPSTINPCHPVYVEKRYYQQYSVFRWLELIDLLNPEGEPVKVQIRVNDMKMWEQQRNLMPGSLVVITYCTPHLSFLGKWISSSQYSEMFCTTNQISDYCKRMPLSYFNGIKEYFNCSPWKNLVKKAKFTIGGAYIQRICHEQYFTECKPDEEADYINSFHYPRNSFRTYEVQRVCFTGRIINSFNKQSYYSKFENKKCVTSVNLTEEVSLGPLITYDSFLRWTGTRKLDKLSVENLSTAKEIMNEISAQYKKYADCIFCLFTENSLWPKTKTDLELSEKMEYYILEIENECCVYYAYWYGNWNSKEEMENKLRAAEGRDVNVLIDIQKLQVPRKSDPEFEVIVHDFMIVD